MNDPRDLRLIELTELADKAFADRDKDKIGYVIAQGENLLNDNTVNLFSKACIYYSLATSYADLRVIDNSTLSEEVCLEKRLFYNQKSVDILEEHFRDDKTEYLPYIMGLKLPLFTNYGNLLSETGRITEAIRFFLMALDIDHNFVMAQGNLGIAYISYAIIQYDPLNRDILNCIGHKYLQMALAHKDKPDDDSYHIFQYYINSFDKDYLEYLTNYKLEFENCFEAIEINEKDYRLWVLGNQLFINSLNDLPFIESAFACDRMHMPNTIMGIKNGLDYKYHGLYNCIKQEYVSARFMLYESIQNPALETHFSDKGTYILNTLDYPSYSLRIERMKWGYRMLYSIFDKIAFFLNEYFDLGIEERDVNFRSIWNTSKETGKGKTKYRFKTL